MINSIQQGLAAELDFQAIIDLVGDKLRDVFHTRDLFDHTGTRIDTNLVHHMYVYEHDMRLSPAARPLPPSGGCL